MIVTERHVLSLLDHLERREERLLTWGFINGAFTREEIEEAARDVLEGSTDDAVAGLVRELEARRLLFELPEQGGYRTRFGEAVRLFATLRQRFKPDDWQTAPNLVADFRLLTRPRRYPSRTIDADEAQPLAARDLKMLRADDGLAVVTEQSGKIVS